MIEQKQARYNFMLEVVGEFLKLKVSFADEKERKVFKGVREKYEDGCCS